MTGRLLVIACPRCRRARVVERGKRTATCAVCGRTLKVPQSRVLFETDDELAARDAAGAANAALAGREAEYQSSLTALAAPAPTPAATRHEAALRALRAAPNPLRVEEAARALGEFTRDELAAVLSEAGLPVRAEEALRQMAVRGVLVEPRSGRYRIVG